MKKLILLVALFQAPFPFEKVLPKQDVPAIQRGFCHGSLVIAVSQKTPGPICPVWHEGIYIEDLETQWTCADPTRVLLTAENGEHHCVKFTLGK